ncbi:MAG TPA: Rieske 2Fe-2S domain-containing protein [Candidatus Dormibacteraeota bacterium]|nr:Rieske 2Fe-2S domain-containing protein [Candidatus Dormibacteraeota bacterium]
MLTTEENEVLCRVGPDTPMGKVLRRYWTPAFQLADLPKPDCPPIRVTVLGENFVAFRDTKGRLGFLDELCCHRGASLALGRVEDCGIRCIYHGWKFAVDGTILEMPNFPNSTFKDRVKHGSYPVRESGGLGWVYLGPPGTEPPFPNFAWSDLPPEEIEVSEMILDCNWMQVQEGSIDSSHVGVLHLDTLAVSDPGPRTVGSFQFAGEPWDLGLIPPRVSDPRGFGVEERNGNPQEGTPARPARRGVGWPSTDNGPRIEVEYTPFGFHYAAIREVTGDPTKKYVRITAFVMPYTAFIAGATGAIMVVPRDDYTCSSIIVSPVPKDAEGRPMRGLANRGIDPSVWGPEPERRRLRIPPQDREAMAAGKSFAGFRGGNRIQDAAVQMSEGKLYDRRKEHLVPADLAIIRLRRLLLDSVRLVEQGKKPLGLGEGYDFTKVSGLSAVVSADTRWQDLVPGHQGIPSRSSQVEA